MVIRCCVTGCDTVALTEAAVKHRTKSRSKPRFGGVGRMSQRKKFEGDVVSIINRRRLFDDNDDGLVSSTSFILRSKADDDYHSGRTDHCDV